MFPSRFFPDRYFAPRYWPKVGADAETPTNTTPTRRFGTGIQATTFKGDPATTALRANAGRTTFAVDESSQVFGSPRRATVFRGDDDE